MTNVFEHGYALVVGVDDNNIKRLALPTVAKDVQAIYDVLVHPERCAYKEDNVKFIKGSESTRINIMEGLDWLSEKVENDPKATAVIYYSGHGWVDKSTDKYYLIPYDILDLKKVKMYAVEATILTDTISNIAAKRLLVLLDCCHAGGMGIKNVVQEETPVSTPFPIDSFAVTKDIPDFGDSPGAKAVSDLEEGNGRAILNSSTGAQSSYVRQDGKMSLFTYHLIEALTGHAPHPDDATVVYVTDVMSWVTHEVKKSAAREKVEQTPVMRTSGVFPVAQLIGGKGVAKGLGETPPDPLAPLPSIQIGHAEGAVIGGNVKTDGGDFAGRDINKSTTNIETGGGSYVAGDQNISGDFVAGDKFTGDKVMGDKVEGDKISVGDISGSSGIAIGRGSSAQVTTTTVHGGGSTDFDQIFAPLQNMVTQQKPEVIGKVNELKAQVQAGSAADDKRIARLITNIGDEVPASKSTIAAIFKNPALAEIAAGPRTEFVLEDF